MDPRPPPEDVRTDEVVDVAHHQDAPDRKPDRRAVAPVGRERGGAGPPDQPAPHHRQDRHDDRDDAPEHGVRKAGGPEGEPDEQALDRGGEAGSDQRGERDVPEALPQDLGVLGRERNEGPDALPRPGGRYQQVEEPEKRDGELDAEPGGRADQAQRAAAGPRDDLGAERLDLGADVVWAEAKLAQPGQQRALEHARRHPLRLVGDQADERDAGPDHQHQGDKNYDTRRQPGSERPA